MQPTHLKEKRITLIKISYTFKRNYFKKVNINQLAFLAFKIKEKYLYKNQNKYLSKFEKKYRVIKYLI